MMGILTCMAKPAVGQRLATPLIPAFFNFDQFLKSQNFISSESSRGKNIILKRKI